MLNTYIVESMIEKTIGNGIMGQRYEKSRQNVSDNKRNLERLHKDKETLQNEYTPLEALEKIQSLMDDDVSDVVTDVKNVGNFENQHIDSETETVNEEKKEIASEINSEIAKLNSGLEKLRQTNGIEFGKNAVEKSSQEYKMQIEKFKALMDDLLSATGEGDSAKVEHIIQNNSELIESLPNESSDSNIVNKQSDLNLSDDKNNGMIPVKQTEHRPLASSHVDAINGIIDDIRIGAGRTITIEQAEKYFDSVQVFSSQDMTGGNNDYRSIRDAYNNPDAPLIDKERLNNLDEYLNNAPKWEGEIYRGINIDRNTAESILSNTEVDMLGPASWSSDFDTAERFSRGSKPVRMVFVLPDNKSGSSITHIASFGSMESEITAPSGIKYSIVDHQKVLKDGREYTYVFLKE